MALCLAHPDQETALACGICGQAACVDCLLHTSVGLRCRDCAHGVEKKVAEAAAVAVPRLEWHFVVGLLAAVLVPVYMGLFAPVAAMYELMLIVGLALHYRMPGVRALVIGFIYAVIFFLAVLTPVARAALPAHVVLAHLHLSAMHTTLPAALICVIGGVGLWFYLLDPARHITVQFLEQGKHFLAGATAGCVFVIEFVSLLITVFLLTIIR